MTDRQNKIKNEASDAEELKRYLFFETDDAERERLEARFFDDDRLFYELLDLENDLTDRFARGQLDEKDTQRFAASLDKSPERRAKLVNANALQSLIAEETNLIASSPAAPPNANFWDKTARFFNFSAANFQYAFAVALLLMAAGIGFLIYERQRDGQELARWREGENQRQSEIQRREQELREQIRTVEEREHGLQTELANELAQTDILTDQLNREQSEKARLARELENLRRQKTPSFQPSAPIVATIILAPVGGKGGGEDRPVSVRQNTKTVFAILQIPNDSAAETFSVRLNSAPLAESLKVNRAKSGGKFIRLSFPAKSLSAEQENTLSAIGSDGSRYNYILRRK